jgi:hypothetical protein
MSSVADNIFLMSLLLGKLRERTLYGIAYNIHQYSRLTVHGDVLLEPL